MSNSAVIGNSLKYSDTRFLHTKGKEGGEYPLTPTTKVVDPLKLRRPIVNCSSEIIIQDLKEYNAKQEGR